MCIRDRDIIEELIRVNKNIKSLVVVGDTMQSIYGFRNTSPENLMNFGSRFQGTVNIDLTKNFRSDRGIVDWANTVSYTHLDVYKRQAYHRENKKRSFFIKH